MDPLHVIHVVAVAGMRASAESELERHGRDVQAERVRDDYGQDQEEDPMVANDEVEP